MTENEMIEQTTVGFFTDNKGRLSMRRLLSFLLCLTSIAIILLSAWKNLDWKLALVVSSVPLLGSLLFMFFTSWESVSKVVGGARGLKD